MTTGLTEFKFTPSSHYPDKKLLIGSAKKPSQHTGAIGMKGSSILTQEAWYDPREHGYDTNKIAGITFDKRITINSSGFWNHRNSMRIGWIPYSVKYMFKIYLYMHVDGRPYIPKPYSEVYIGTVVADLHFDWDLAAHSKETQSAISQKGEMFEDVTSLKIFTTGPGYILDPYHGGNKRPLNKYSLFTKAELIYPI